ncbi:MAG: c-type cytochrome biogenesis protein CcmI, partial [Pseudomonadota bacterium]
MVFWIVCAVMTLAVLALLCVPLMRPAKPTADNPDVAIYKAQLDEIDRDLERDLIAPDEAERAKAEVARRLIAASKQNRADDNAGGPNKWVTGIVVVLTGAAGFGIYWVVGAPGYPDLPLQARLAASAEMRANRPVQAALEAVAPPPPPVEVPDDYRAAIGQLREIAPTRPDDLEAWSRLTFHEIELRNYAGAADAQAQVIA